MIFCLVGAAFHEVSERAVINHCLAHGMRNDDPVDGGDICETKKETDNREFCEAEKSRQIPGFFIPEKPADQRFDTRAENEQKRETDGSEQYGRE